LNTPAILLIIVNVELGQRWKTSLMFTDSQTPSSQSAALLAAAMILCRLHGLFYARCFLEEQGVDKDVITELLGLPSRQHPVEGFDTSDGNSC
jgi:hypothetical protein